MVTDIISVHYSIYHSSSNFSTHSDIKLIYCTVNKSSSTKIWRHLCFARQVFNATVESLCVFKADLRTTSFSSAWVEWLL